LRVRVPPIATDMNKKTHVCVNCGELPIERFRPHITRGYQNHCIECRAEYNRKHYLKNKDKYKDRATKRRKRMSDLVNEYKYDFLLTHPCADCGERDVVVLEFHHVNKEDKLFCVSKTEGRNMDAIKAEIDKCIVLCANCHKRRTFKEFGYYKYVRAEKDRAQATVAE